MQIGPIYARAVEPISYGTIVALMAGVVFWLILRPLQDRWPRRDRAMLNKEFQCQTSIVENSSPEQQRSQLA